MTDSIFWKHLCDVNFWVYSFAHVPSAKVEVGPLAKLEQATTGFT